MENLTEGYPPKTTGFNRLAFWKSTSISIRRTSSSLKSVCHEIMSKDGFPSGLLKISITSKVFLQEIQDCPLPENWTERRAYQSSSKQHLSRVKRIQESEVEAKNQKKNIVITWGCASAPVSPCKFLAPRNKHHSQRCTSRAHIRVLFVCAFCTKHLCLSVQLVVLQHCSVTNCAQLWNGPLVAKPTHAVPCVPATQTTDMPRVIFVHYTLKIY